MKMKRIGFMFGVIIFAGLCWAYIQISKQPPADHLLWKFKTMAEKCQEGPSCSRTFSPPLVSNGIVYVVSPSLESLYALDSKTGKLVWDFKLNTYDHYSPVVFLSQGIVYVSDGRGYLRALDAQTGQQKWIFKVEGLVDEYTSDSIQALDGLVYVIDNESYLYALDHETGQEKWRFEGNKEYGFRAFAVKQKTVYIESGNLFYALDAVTGQQKWQISVKDRFISVDAISSVVVYVSERHAFYVLDVQTGLELQKFDLEGYDIVSPTISRDVAYFDDEALHSYIAFDLKKGQEKWRTKIVGDVIDAEVILDGIIYFSTDNYVYGLDLQTGQQKQKFALSAFDIVVYPVVRPDHTLYYKGTESFLHAIDVRTGQQKWKIGTGDHYYYYSIDTLLTTVDGVLYLNTNSYLFAIK